MKRKPNRVVKWPRTFRSLPEKASSQTAAVLTTILFAITLGVLAMEIARQVQGIANGTVPAKECVTISADGVEDEDPDCEPTDDGQALYARHIERNTGSRSDALSARMPILSHLALATVVIFFSALGYYESRQRPRLKVKFFNKTFLQASIDLTSIGLYYVLVELTEPTSEEASVFPEAILISAIFGLYVAWDAANYRIEADEHAQLALRKAPRQQLKYGYRRYVSLWFAVILIVLSLIYCCVNSLTTDPVSKTLVVLVDAIFIVLMVAYRVAKSIGDRESHYRGEFDDRGKEGHEIDGTAKACCHTGSSCGGICDPCDGRSGCQAVRNIRRGRGSEVNLGELKEMLPEINGHSVHVLKQIGAMGTASTCSCGPTQTSHAVATIAPQTLTQNDSLWKRAFIADMKETHEDYLESYIEIYVTKCDSCCKPERSTACRKHCCCLVRPKTPQCDDDAATKCGDGKGRTSGGSGGGSSPEPPQTCGPVRVRLTEFGQYIYGIISKERGQCADRHCPCIRRTGCCGTAPCKTEDQEPNSEEQPGNSNDV